MNFLFLLVSLIGFANARETAQYDRFQPHLVELENPFYSSDNIRTVVDNLTRGNARILAFNLQALGKIYEDKGKKFKKIREDFKAIEDNIGEVDKWDNALNHAQRDNRPANIIQRLEQHLETAKTNFADYLREREWVTEKRSHSRLQKWKEYLEEYDWDSYADDREYVLRHLTHNLKTLLETEFDFSHLEEGNGLHEYRREVRWFIMKAKNLNGLITFKEDRNSCPIAEYQELLQGGQTQSRYSNLPAPGPRELNPCRISACLYYAMVKIVADIGELKDRAEVAGLTAAQETDAVPAEIRVQAEQIYQRMRSLNLLPTVRNEIRACRNDD